MASQKAAVRRTIELSVTKYCPAHAMLSKVFPIASVYDIYENNGTEHVLVVNDKF